MTDSTEKPALKPAEKNSDYLLATLYGEPGGDRVIQAQNREAWNRYHARHLTNEQRKQLEGRVHKDDLAALSQQELTDIEQRFEAWAGGKVESWRSGPGAIDLKGIVIENPAFFRGFIFSGDTSFIGTRFSSEANFEGAIFLKSVNFEDAVFCDRADFQGATFDGNVSFTKTEFANVATFKGASFNGKNGYVKLPNGKDSTVKHFKGNVTFKGATFNGMADFSETRFSGWSNFTDVKFLGASSFWGAAFSAETDAIFSKATFSGSADFRKAKFERHTDFSSAKFLPVPDPVTEADGHIQFGPLPGSTYFSNAEFKGRAIFNKTQFMRHAEFEKAKFCGEVEFINAHFDRGVFFTGAKLKASTDFDGCRFEKTPPQLAGATLHPRTNWRRVSWPRLEGLKLKEVEDLTDAYGILKLQMEAQKRHLDELMFFAEELKCRRQELLLAECELGEKILTFTRRIPEFLKGAWKWVKGLPTRLYRWVCGLRLRSILIFIHRTLKWFKGLPIQLYGWTCDYGQSFMLPLFWLIILVAIGFDVITMVLQPDLSWEQALLLSVANCFGSFGFRKDMLGNLTNCLSVCTHLFSLFQGIIALILLFLTGLGLRNRFRMK